LATSIGGIVAFLLRQRGIGQLEQDVPLAGDALEIIEQLPQARSRRPTLRRLFKVHPATVSRLLAQTAVAVGTATAPKL
jgi:hypothetical protein